MYVRRSIYVLCPGGILFRVKQIELDGNFFVLAVVLNILGEKNIVHQKNAFRFTTHL